MDVSERRFRQLVDAVADYAIFMLDATGHVMTWNPGAERTKGYKASEIVGRHFSAFYTAEDRAAGVPDAVLETVRREGRYEAESWRVRKDGTRFWANVVITALRDADGNVTGFAKVTRDLTDRRNAEEALRRSEERFRLLVESVSDYAICMLDPNGIVTTWNAGAEKIKGYTANEILGKSYRVFFTEEAREAKKPETELAVAKAEGRFQEEGWRVRKDGSQFWASVAVTALRDAHGHLVGFAKITRDLTDRRQAEQTARDLLREQTARAVAQAAEARYRTLSERLEIIFEGVGDAIVVYDRDGVVRFANGGATLLLGYASVDDLLADGPHALTKNVEIFDEQGVRVPTDALPGAKVLAGATTASATLRVRERATGRSGWSSVRARAVLGAETEPDLAVTIWHDVSLERRRRPHEGLLAQATIALSSSLDYHDAMAAMAAVVVPELADWCSVHLVEGGVLTNVVRVNGDAQQIAHARELEKRYPPDRARDEGVWGVIHSGRARLHALVDEATLTRDIADPEKRRMVATLGIRSAIIAPIRVGDETRGTLSLAIAGSDRTFDAMDVALAEELGRRAGALVENAQLYAAEKRARAQLELVARAGEALSASLDYHATLRTAVAVVLPALADFAFFDIIEGDDVRRTAAAHDDPELDALVKASRWERSWRTDVSFCALSTGQPAFHRDIDRAWLESAATSPQHRALLDRLHLCSMLSVPMRSRGVVIGALTMCYGKSGRHHAPDDLALAEELARRAAVAVTQARLYEESRAAARRAEEASRVKDEFLATVSHELRTPLNAIVGWSSLLREQSRDTAFAKGIDAIFRNAQAQAKIVEDILDVSRIITGKLALDVQLVDLAAIIRDALEVVRPSAAAKAIDLRFDPPAEPFTLLGDPERLQQVAWNLLSNALKFTPPNGSVEVRIEREQSAFVLSVVDTGRGIDSAFLPYVFDRFKQADSSSTRQIGGLGLGLAIVRHIVELHGGQVEASSAGLGHGATFRVVLPVRAVASVPPRAVAHPEVAHETAKRATSERVRGLDVLVVDDEPDARDLLETALAGFGISARTAASAAEAYASYRQRVPDVLVSDIGMPDEDGHSLIRRIRALRPEEGGDRPAIALTAYARADDKAKARAAGFTTHVGKPVDPADLVETVGSPGTELEFAL